MKVIELYRKKHYSGIVVPDGAFFVIMNKVKCCEIYHR